MINANEAKEMVKQYFVKQEEEYKQTATHKLEIISKDIGHNAQNGLSFLRYGDSLGFFQSLRVEEIAIEELKNLGYEVCTNNGHFIVKWGN